MGTIGKKARSRAGPRGEVADAEAQRMGRQGQGPVGCGARNPAHTNMGARYKRQSEQCNKNVT